MKPGRWYQFHLSTVLAVTIAAGGLILLNLREKPIPKPAGQEWRCCYLGRGYPFVFADRWEPQLLSALSEDPEKLNRLCLTNYHAFEAFLDAVAAAVVLIILLIILEYFARRSQVARK